MEPTKENIAKLTYKQRDAIQDMQRNGAIIPAPGHATRTYNYLVRVRIARSKKRADGKVSFRLYAKWLTVDVARKSQADMRIERMAVRLKAMQVRAGKRESPVFPDAHKKIKRPPAEYSNPSWEARMNQILNA